MSETRPPDRADDSRVPGAATSASVLLLFVLARLLTAEWRYFWEQDDVSIAAGAAALVRGADAGLYRYGPQLGYYRLVQGLTSVLGGDVSIVPHLMIGISAICGGLVPWLALRAFRAELPWTTRRLVAASLLANPLLWTSSRYGNTAMAALAAGVAAVTLLSNRPRGAREVAALGLLGAAILLRADSVLVLPVAVLLLFRTHGTLRAALLRAGGLAAITAAAYLAALVLDPRMDDVVTTTAVHLFNPQFRTQFWEYLLWAMSPLVLVLAAWGLRDLFETRSPLFAVVALWCLPVFAFYFGSTTTPRYMLLVVVPLTVCAVLGAQSLLASLERRTPRRWLSRGVVATMAGAHLFVGLGQFTSDRPSAPFTDAVLFTHDGPHPTGGLLWHGVAAAGETLSRPRFGATVPYATGIDAWLRAPGAPRRIVYVCDGEPAGTFRFHALAAGARVTHRLPGPDDRRATTYQVGGVAVTWVDAYLALAEMGPFDVAAGDEFWNMRPDVPAEEVRHFPPGLGLETLPSPAGGVRAYRFVPLRPGDGR